MSSPSALRPSLNIFTHLCRDFSISLKTFPFAFLPYSAKLLPIAGVFRVVVSADVVWCCAELLLTRISNFLSSFWAAKSFFRR